MALKPCTACDGEGRNIRMGLVYEPGCTHAHHGEVDRGPCEACDGAGAVEVPPAFYSVGIYKVDQAYGGPEEGGWWYQCGELVSAEMVATIGAEHGLPRSFEKEEDAIKWRDAVQTVLDADVNEGRRPIDSVLSDGVYHAQVHDEMLPHHYPTTRPHYE